MNQDIVDGLLPTLHDLSLSLEVSERIFNELKQMIKNCLDKNIKVRVTSMRILKTK